MKPCPDCAESIQDGARKCRYCGYRFDALADGADAPAPATTAAVAPVVAATPPAAAESSVPWLLLLVGIGGVLFAVGGGALCYAVGSGGIETTTSYLTEVGILGGGLLLTIAWGCLLAKGHLDVWPLLGGIALLISHIIMFTMAGSGESQVFLRGLAFTCGMVLFFFAQLDGLKSLELHGARLAAILSLIGICAELYGIFKKHQVPGIVSQGFAWLGFGGITLFGIALAMGAIRRFRS